MNTRSNTKPSRILCVEDDLDIQTITEIALKDVGGFEVKVCSSGQEALDVVKEFKPDLILLDVMMPGMDGPTTLKHFRADPDTAEIPVIFVTAKVQVDEVERYINMGSLGVIRKPFDPMNLANEIISLWRKQDG